MWGVRSGKFELLRKKSGSNWGRNFKKVRTFEFELYLSSNLMVRTFSEFEHEKFELFLKFDLSSKSSNFSRKIFFFEKFFKKSFFNIKNFRKKIFGQKNFEKKFLEIKF